MSPSIFCGREVVVVVLLVGGGVVVDVDGEEVISDIIEKEFEQRQLRQGDEILLYFPPEAFMVYPAKEGLQ